MGTDMSDVYTHSHVLKGILCLPLGAIVEVTFKRMAKYFNNTSGAANEAIKNPAIEFPQRVQDDMNLKMQKAHKHQVTICMNPKNKNVILGGDVVKYEVQTGQKSVTVHLYSKSNRIMKKSGGCTLRKSAACSCNKLRLLRRPCSHVMAVCCQIGVSTSTCMSPYYSLSYLDTPKTVGTLTTAVKLVRLVPRSISTVPSSSACPKLRTTTMQAQRATAEATIEQELLTRTGH
ncbi:hypothetical protein ACQ4PT_032190 [Festuca glaucescens]